METLIQISGVQYACKENGVGAVMAEMEQQKPEVLLVTEQTHDFGIIVRALTGTECRGVVSRFDLEHVLGMMRHDGTSVLVGRVAETDAEGRCFTVSVAGDYPDTDTASCHTTPLWTEWQWTGAPLMDSSDDSRRLDISLKVTLAELRRNGRIHKQTLLEHLRLVLELTKWDVSRETQEQLGELQRLVRQHTDRDIRALAPQFRHTIAALGSKQRISEFQDTYLPALVQSNEARQMLHLWRNIHKAELSNFEQWQQTVCHQMDTIEQCLMQLPADLGYQKDQFGPLMHRLLYLGIPRRQLLMLLSAIVLRQLLRKQLGMTDSDTEAIGQDTELQLALQLAPIFYGNTDSAREFLMLVRGKKSVDIILIVNLWLRDRRICPDHCHRPLWTILHNAGIYTATESNWNSLLDVRKSYR